MEKGRDYWSWHIDAWRRSGQSRKAYCEEHGLVVLVDARLG